MSTNLEAVVPGGLIRHISEDGGPRVRMGQLSKSHTNISECPTDHHQLWDIEGTAAGGALDGPGPSLSLRQDGVQCVCNMCSPTLIQQIHTLYLHKFIAQNIKYS